MRNFKKKIHHF